MGKNRKGVPEGFHTLSPYLIVRNADRAIEFYKQAFGAQLKSVHHMPDGRIMNAQLQIGDSMLLLNEEFPEFGSLSPLALTGTSVTLHLYVDDVDAAFSQAVGAGATIESPLEDAFWGDRFGKLKDPFGHGWSIATRLREVSEEEVARAAAATFGQRQG